MFSDTQETPKRRPFVAPTSRNASVTMNKCGFEPNTNSDNSTNFISKCASNGNLNVQQSDVLFNREGQTEVSSNSAFHRAHSTMILQQESSSKTDFSALESMRLGFSWLQHSQNNQLGQENNRSTPSKSQHFGIHVLNPFESDLVETMQMSSCSPSVFSKVVTPSKAESENEVFSWGVENAALLYPKEFGDNHNQTAPMVDEATEEKVQSAIDTYFTQKIHVPSPWIENGVRDVNRSSLDIDDEFVELKNPTKRNVWCQTTLTIPVDVDLHAILAGYFNFDDNQERLEDENGKEILSVSNLRRKLFLDRDGLEESDLIQSPANVTRDRNYSMEPIHSTSSDVFEDSCQANDSISDRYQRATSISPPKDIESPTHSPIKPYTDERLEDVKCSEMVSVSVSCASLASTPSFEVKLPSIDEQNEELSHSEVSALHWDSNMETSAVAVIPSSLNDDNGYKSAATAESLSLFSTSMPPRIALHSIDSHGAESLVPKSQLMVPNDFTKTNLSCVDKSRLQNDSSWSPSVFSTPSKQNTSL